VVLQQGDARLPTLTDVYAGAALYEREVNELMGIEFDGHPSMNRLILPEQWPQGKHPLRKDRTGDATQGDVSQGDTTNN
jgi:NADH-quinone oxidoreductase subunit C/D